MENQNNEQNELQAVSDVFFSQQAKLAALLGDISGVTARPVEHWRSHSNEAVQSQAKISGCFAVRA